MDNVPAWMKLAALMVVGGVAKALFAPPDIRYVTNVTTDTTPSQTADQEGA